MTVNPWSEEHISKLLKLEQERTEHAVIASILGRSPKAINAKLAMLRLSPEKRAARAERKRKYAIMSYPGRNAKGVGFFTPDGARPEQDVLEERNQRLSIPARDLTAAYFGDPLPGYSALERRT